VSNDNEHGKQESFTIAGGDSGWVFTPTQHPTPEEQYASEQKMFNEALVRNVIATITDNPVLARDFWRALLAALPAINPQAPQYDDVRRELKILLDESEKP
jgi:hypothetical protein